MKKFIFIIILLISAYSFSQDRDALYEDAYKKLTEMLEDKRKLSFKEAVFTVENAYLMGNLDTIFVNSQINILTKLAYKLTQSRQLKYNESDKEVISKYAAIFTVMTDTIPITDGVNTYKYIPFSYDFDDFFGHRDWRKMFVSKLLETHKGNCHSLPYLYKIIAEKMGVEAHLALAPNHIYIKHRNKANGWYNTELTSGIFPLDAWIMASGFVHIDAIVNGVYMKALSEKESIALCLVDLAQGYQKSAFYDTDFVIKCADKALEYYPNYVDAMILKTETLGKIINNKLKYKFNTDFSDVLKFEETAKLFYQLQTDLGKIHQLGYRQMPEDMYLSWLVSLKTERSKYENKKINIFTKPNKL